MLIPNPSSLLGYLSRIFSRTNSSFSLVRYSLCICWIKICNAVSYLQVIRNKQTKNYDRVQCNWKNLILEVH